MNARFNYEIAKQRAADLARVGARQRIANEVRAGQSEHGVAASSRCVSGGLAGAAYNLRRVRRVATRSE